MCHDTAAHRRWENYVVSLFILFIEIKNPPDLLCPTDRLRNNITTDNNNNY